MIDLKFIFSDSGPLAAAIDNYRFRPQQLEMAQLVSNTIRDNKVALVEAGTGTGKTCAYLAPALLSGGKVIISTGTRTLQDQLFYRDIPAVRDALNIPVSVALLKGRANYVCHHHLDRSLKEGRFLEKQEVSYLQTIDRFARTSTSGDKNDLPDVPETSPVWSDVTSTRDNCLGSGCKFYDECFVMAARRKALRADTVIVNHHLFFADVWLRDEGISELLPACNTVIFDEAHQLPETASLFFGESLSTGQCLELAKDVLVEVKTSASDFALLPQAAEVLEKTTKSLRLSLGSDVARCTWKTIKDPEHFSRSLGDLEVVLLRLKNLLETQVERSDGLRRCFERSCKILATLKLWTSAAEDNYVRWLDVFTQSLQLNITPLSIAEIFKNQVEENYRSWIFTSATMSVNGDFNLYREQLGLEDAACVSWESPFDYSKQALLYLPQDMSDPNSSGYVAEVVQASLPVIKANKGRAFCLFTSLRAMREAYELYSEQFKKRNSKVQLLLQGAESKTELLRKFRLAPNPVLIGSISFWQGVDVRGDTLSLVIIDKLPFTSPDEPVLAARIKNLQQRGKNAFIEYQLPQAAILLKQGAGRLIRDETDKGILMICDPRLKSKAYGRQIMRSLPKMQVTQELREVKRFLGVCGEVQPPALATPTIS